MSYKVLDYNEGNGLVLCKSPDNAENNSEILYINDAQRLRVDSILFRRYYDGEQLTSVRSEPAVYTFLREDDFFNSKEHIELHAALWSAGKNEVYIIKSPSRLDIINARKPAELSRSKELSIENIVLASSTAIRGINETLFSASYFSNGTFWEQPEFEQKLDEKDSPYIFLLDYLMTIRAVLLNDPSLRLAPETIDKLLVTCILIKFLEEIKDDQGKHTLRNIYKKNQVQTFAEVIEKKLTVEVLNDLANEFNGKIFDKFTVEEKTIITKSNLSSLADFLRANINVRSGQLFLWEQYSFKHLPAEIISAIYENFIQAEAMRQNGDNEKGVVYTPIHLVNFLVDEMMPIHKPKLFLNNSFKILDPTCGSGVFLVAAFKRLLQWWTINHIKNNVIRYPDSKEAQKILEDNIFGIDVKKTATLVSVFGLTTALLDKLTPQEIWNNLVFKDLSSNNIQHRDFFEWALDAQSKVLKFDLIIGNPPFNVETGKSKQDIITPAILQKLKLTHKRIPNNNFALHFFEVSMIFSKSVCLIIPSTVLLYNKSAHAYRQELFTNYTISKIYDFTHLREVLFAKKNNTNNKQKKIGRTPVVAIIASNTPSLQQSINHIIVKRTVSVEKKIRFEIDYYDTHQVRWDWAIDKSKGFVWKTNLLGGGRLFQIVYRLSLLPTLKEFILCKKSKNPEWQYSSGYKVGGTSTVKVPAEFLSGKPTINTAIKFDHNQGKYSTITECNTEFEAPRNKELFKEPLLVISEIINDKGIPMQIFDHYQPFNISFLGIHAPANDKTSLETIYNRFHRKGNLFRLFHMYMLVTSSKLLIHKETAFVKEDFDMLPFPQDESMLTISEEEELIVNDVLEYYIHLGKSISNRSAGNFLLQEVNRAQLISFGQVFCNSLNMLYAKGEKSWQEGQISYSGPYTIYQFGFGKTDELERTTQNISSDQLSTLIENKLSNSGAIYKRLIRIYQHINGFDCIFLIKPNTLRYWLPSIALKDADDTFSDLKSAGY
jgi:type I restriction-modification system DNA methylase subunit